MAIGDDFEIQVDKDIRHVSGTTNYTVLELHRWVQGLADNASSTGDDNMDITIDTPSDKQYDTIVTLINGFNIDDTASQFLYGGSIIQDDGDEIYDGLKVLAPAGMRLEIIQNGALVSTNFWTTGINADATNGISHQFLLKVRTAGADIDGRRIIGTSREWGKSFLEYPVNGTARGENVLAFTSWADDLNNTTASATVATWTTIANVTEGYNGIDVNNDTTDEYYYSEWNKATYAINQFYERMKYLVRRGTAETLYGLSGDLFRGITHQIAVDTQSATDWIAVEPVSWTGGTGQMLAVDDLNASTTIWIQLLTGVAPTDGLTITGGTSGATADVNVTVTERPVSGTAPFCGQSTGTSIIGAYGFGIEALDLSSADKVFDLTNTQYQAPNYATFNFNGLETSGTADYATVGPLGYRFNYDNEALGPFTKGETLTFTTPAGTAVLADIIDRGTVGELIIGPMLTGSVPTDDSGITGGTSSATADVNGTVHNSINKRQLTLNGLLNGAAVTSVVVTETIPADTPSTGNIRIQRNSGKYTLHPYSAWTGSTFTITSHDFSTDTALDDTNVYIAYIDKAAAASTESFTGVYSGDRALYIRCRNGGAAPIKTFQTTGTLGSGGGSATAVRTSDL